MATYPIKVLSDETGTPFIPLVNAEAIVDANGLTLEEKLANKLEATNLIGGDNILLTVEGNNITIATDNSGAENNVVNNLTTNSSGVGVLDAYQGKVLNDTIEEVKGEIPEVINNVETVDTVNALSAYQGYLLKQQVVPTGGAEGQVLKKSSDKNHALEWGDAADPNAIIGDGSIKKIVEVTYDEYTALEEAGQLEDTTEYHISDWNENERTYLTETDIQEMIDETTDTMMDLKYSTLLEEGVDLDDIVVPGVYKATTSAVSSILNKPVGYVSAFTLNVLQYASNIDNPTNIRQEAIMGRGICIRRTVDGGATWTDWEVIAHYGIGDILITNTNTSPSVRLTGEWSLINKEFSSYKDAPTESLATYFTVTENAELTSFAWVCNGNTMSIRVGLKPLVVLGDAQVNLGQLNMTALGISRLPLSRYAQLAGSDTGEGAVMYNITYDGIVNAVDFIPITDGGTMPANTSSIYIEQTYVFNQSYMLDDNCNRFYWQRTA